MSTIHIDRTVGRSIFGADAAGYEAGRLSYPDALYGILESECGLHAGASVFEIGPSTGQATCDLVKRGANVTAIEPDAALAMSLSNLPKARSDWNARHTTRSSERLNSAHKSCERSSPPSRRCARPRTPTATHASMRRRPWRAKKPWMAR